MRPGPNSMKKNEMTRWGLIDLLLLGRSPARRQAGFTLVEIAIALIRVRLLLAVVVKGQQVANSSKAKALLASQAAVQTGINLYQDRYRALPGDDGRASSRFSAAQCGAGSVGALACSNGDGNGAIVGPYTSQVNAATAATVVDGAGNEVSKVWQHLRAAGLLRVDGDSCFSNPLNGVGGSIAVAGTSVAGGNAPYVGMAPASLYLVFTGLPRDVAQILDDAVDDGLANRGSYRGLANGTPSNPNSDPAGINYDADAITIATPLL